MATTNQQQPGPQRDGGNMGGTEEQGNMGLNEPMKTGTASRDRSEMVQNTSMPAGKAQSDQGGEEDENQETGEMGTCVAGNKPVKDIGDTSSGTPGANSYSNAQNKRQGARTGDPESGDGDNRGADS